MTKQEFKNTIEYKTYKTQIRILATVMAVVIAINWIMGLVFFLWLYFDSYKSEAVIVLISLIILPLVRSIIPIIGICSQHNKISPIYSYLNDLYIFDYRLGKAICNRYQIIFEYENHKLDIISSDLGNNDLDYKLVKVGYIKELNRVVILEKISR